MFTLQESRRQQRNNTEAVSSQMLQCEFQKPFERGTITTVEDVVRFEVHVEVHVERFEVHVEDVRFLDPGPGVLLGPQQGG